jgi:hypothetical protein
MQANLSSVRTRRAIISRQLTALQSEDAELATVEKILERLGGLRATQVRTPGKPGRVVKRGNGAAKAGRAGKQNDVAKSRSGISKANGATRANGAIKATAAIKAKGARRLNGAIKANGAVKANGAAKAKPVAKGPRGKRGGASQRELVLAALKRPGAGWMDVRAIIAHVKDTHGVAMPPRSISPLLSNLKRAGAVVRKGRLVAAPERARAANR